MNIPYADIVILALVAGFILLRLRSILGQDAGFDPRKSNPPEKRDDAPTADARRNESKADAGVLSFPPLVKATQKLKAELEVPSDQGLIDGLDFSSKLAVDGIKKIDPTFNLVSFCSGAKAAFEMVIKAFNEADRAVFEMLMKPELAQVFTQESLSRQAGGNKSETTLVSIVSTHVSQVSLNQKIVRIKLVLISEQISVIRDDKNVIIEGDPSRADRVEDEWEFERDISSKNPNWTIIDT